MKSLKSMAMLIMASFVLTGCVTGTRTLENMEIPDLSMEKNASGEIYIASVTDSRVFEQKPRSPSTPSVDGNLSSTSKDQLATLIGRQRNGFGAAMGDVALPEGVTVQDKMKELVAKGLESRGYVVVDDENAENQISIDTSKFWAWFSPGFASVSFESELQCSIDFEHSGGEEKFDVTGYGINKGQIASNANWELAYKRAFEDFLKNLDEVLDDSGL
ncbi:YajG family lipoprotein [Oceanobacter kriegii]|uniref:YajG family lipoprotein n=1 Tax=Oceanobacter kriegii TaxID=64972 RepID=UPI0006884ACF|nr:YajG family lipoprotein [Oceanobacter kriegii]